jgi:NADPH:quinone reductase-like Zn-dependent oxidoreductase
MKAAVYRKYGAPSVVRIEETTAPVAGEKEVLIRIKAALVTSADSAFRQGKPFAARLFTGLFRPRKPVLGTELSGVIEAVGNNVTLFRVGDEVFAATGAQCGAHAEYIVLPESGALAKKPASVSFAEAAGLCEALTALPFLRDGGQIRPGQKVLINGASGSVGSYAVQLAKYFGAKVTAVCSSGNVEQAKMLGADEVIDYTKDDFTLSGRRYDIIFDAAGKSSFGRCKRLLEANGRYLSTVPSMGLLLHMALTSKSKTERAIFMATGLRPPAERAKDLAFIAMLTETGQLKPVVDRVWPFEQIAEAYAYVDTGRKKGNVAVSFGA